MKLVHILGYILLLVITTLLAGQLAIAADQDNLMVCLYKSVQYEAVEAPSQAADWQIVKAALVKCDGYADSGFIRPNEKPDELNFMTSEEKSATIKNREYSLNNILMGPDYPSGQSANIYINESLKKTIGDPLPGVALVSFTSKKCKTLCRHKI